MCSLLEGEFDGFGLPCVCLLLTCSALVYYHGIYIHIVYGIRRRLYIPWYYRPQQLAVPKTGVRGAHD